MSVSWCSCGPAPASVVLIAGSTSAEAVSSLAGHFPKSSFSHFVASSSLDLALKGGKAVPTGPRIYVESHPTYERSLTVRETLVFSLRLTGHCDGRPVAWLHGDARSGAGAVADTISSSESAQLLASKLGLGQLIDTRLFFLSTAQLRTVALGEALLAASAHAARLRSSNAGEAMATATNSSQVQLLAQSTLDGLAPADQSRIACFLQGFARATDVAVVVSTGEDAAIDDRVLSGGFIDRVTLMDSRFSPVFSGSPDQLRTAIQAQATSSISAVDNDSSVGVMTRAKLFLQQQQQGDKGASENLRTALGWNPSPSSTSTPATDAATSADPASPAPATKPALHARQQQASGFVPFFTALTALIGRRFKVITREPMWIWPRPVLSLIFALFLGSLYFQPPFAQFNIKASLASYITVLIAASSMVEARSIVHSALSLHPAIDAKLFSGFAVLVADWVLALPASLLSSLILGLIPFYMVDYADDENRAGFFFLVVLLVDQSFQVLVRFTSQALLSKNSARMASGMYVLFFLFTAGFLLSPSLANKAYYSFYYFFNIFGWALKAWVLSEWTSPAYQQPLPIFNATLGVTGYITPGQFYATMFEIPGALSYSDMVSWKWGAAIIVAAYGALCVPLQACALARCRVRGKPASPKNKKATNATLTKAAKPGGSDVVKPTPDASTSIEMAAVASGASIATSAPATASSPATMGALHFTVHAWPTHITRPRDHPEHPEQVKSRREALYRTGAATASPAASPNAAPSATASGATSPQATARVSPSTHNTSAPVAAAAESYEAAPAPAHEDSVDEPAYHFRMPAGTIAVVGWDRPLDIDTMLCDRQPAKGNEGKPLSVSVPGAMQAWASDRASSSGASETGAVVTINPAIAAASSSSGMQGTDSAPTVGAAVYNIVSNYTFFGEMTLRQSLLFACELRGPQRLVQSSALLDDLKHDTQPTSRPAARELAESILATMGLQEHAGTKLMLLQGSSWVFVAAAIAHELAAIGSVASSRDSVIVLDNILTERGVSIDGFSRLASAMDSVCRAYRGKVSFVITAPAARAEPTGVFCPILSALPSNAGPCIYPLIAARASSAFSLGARPNHTGLNMLSPLESRAWRGLNLVLAGYRGPSAPWIPHGRVHRVMAHLLLRELLRPVRNRSILIGRFIVTPLFLSLFVGVLFSSFDATSFMGSSALVALTFVSSVFGGLASMGAGAQSLFQARHQLRREISAKMYTPGMFVFCTGLSDALWTSVSAIIWTFVAKACAGAITTSSEGRLGSFYLFCWASLLAGNYLGYMAGTVAPHFAGTMIAEQIITPLASLTAGLFIAPSMVPSYWKWLMAANPFSHLMQALLGTDLYCDSMGIPAASPSFPCPKVTLPVVLLQPTSGLPAGVYGRVSGVYAYLSARFGFAYADRWTAYGTSIGIMCVCCLVTIAFIRSFSEVYRRFESARKLRHHYGVPATMTANRAEAAGLSSAGLADNSLGSPLDGPASTMPVELRSD